MKILLVALFVVVCYAADHSDDYCPEGTYKEGSKCKECGYAYESINVKLLGGIKSKRQSWPSTVYINQMVIGEIKVKIPADGGDDGEDDHEEDDDQCTDPDEEVTHDHGFITDDGVTDDGATVTETVDDTTAAAGGGKRKKRDINKRSAQGRHKRMSKSEEDKEDGEDEVFVKLHYHHDCAGTLINRQTVLTDARCFVEEHEFRGKDHPIHFYSGSLEDSIIVYAGDKDLSGGSGDSGVIRGVHRIIMHPEDNIALLILDEPVELSPTINIACVPKSENHFYYPYSGSNAYVVGWGDMEADGSGHGVHNLRNAKMTILDDSDCSNHHKKYVCAATPWYKHKTVDTCIGDLGGALYTLNDEGKAMVAGVIKDEHCDMEAEHTMFHRVFRYADWIRKNWIIHPHKREKEYGPEHEHGHGHGHEHK